jgi:hypothetical protein
MRFQFLFASNLLLLVLVLACKNNNTSNLVKDESNSGITLGFHARRRLPFLTLKNCSYGSLLPLLLMAGDIHPNPGPRTKDPCSVCSRAVKASHHAVCCDNCNKWVHTNCCGMSEGTYRDLQNSSLMWICPQCGIPSFTSSFFEGDSITSTNSFELLSDGSQSSSPQTQNSQRTGQGNLSSSITCLSINLDGLRSKKYSVFEILETSKPDVVFLQETKIDSTILSSEFFPQSYTVIRKDRTEHGGGILIAAKKQLQCMHCPSLESIAEMTWIKIVTKDLPVHLLGVHTGHPVLKMVFLPS